MANVMFISEIGGGFGHLVPYLDLARTLLRHNHQVIFASHDLTNAETVFGKSGVSLLQAPISLHKVPNPYPVQLNYAQLIHNANFSNPHELLARVKAWLHLFHYARPELIIFDYSPTALVAARVLTCKKIISGSGFLIPPAGYPLPNMAYWQECDLDALKQADDSVTRVINVALKALKAPLIEHLEELFQTDEQFLLGFKELDHYPMRKDSNYLGIFPIPDYGNDPVWPEAGEKKVFAYLHPSKIMPNLLQALKTLRTSTIVYAPKINPELRKKHAAPSLHFAAGPLDMLKASRECDAAITNGTYGATCAILLAGKPVLMCPQNLERLLVARRVTEIGAGLMLPLENPELSEEKLNAVLNDVGLQQGASSFAQRYAGLDQAWQTEKMMRIINGLLPGAPAA